MLIDWFTVVAQALNFVILAWLMKRFLYKPILDAINARETRIATELADAARAKTEAQRERDEFQKKNDDFAQQRAMLLQQANADANAERLKLLDAARAAADALTVKRQESLTREAKSLGQALRQRTQNEVFAIARKTLADLASAGLEASACEVFIARLQGLDGPPKDALAAALLGSKDAVLVRSAFELPEAQRNAIRKAIDDTFGATFDLRFENAPDRVAGIELVAQGQKFAWTISEYLASLEQGVSDLLKIETRGPGVVPQPAAGLPTNATAASATAVPAAKNSSSGLTPIAVAT